MTVHSGSNCNLAVLVFEERGKPEYPEKNFSEQGENQQLSQPKYDAGNGNRTRATLVGGECSHNSSIPSGGSMAGGAVELWSPEAPQP